MAQPFDTLKTRMQAYDKGASLYTTFLSIYKSEGVRGLYRGGVPLIIGGALMRSSQFGVYDIVLANLRLKYGTTQPDGRIYGILDHHIVLCPTSYV